MDDLKSEVIVQKMLIEDVDAVLGIDKKIRRIGEALTYLHATTESILTIDRIGRGKNASSYADMITGDIAGMLETSFVAKLNGKVAGFIISRKASIGEPPTEIGLILIMGVNPEHWGKGLAKKLADALIEKYKSLGVRELRIPIDERDMQLRDFFSKMGFGVGHMIDYAKKL
ncbi:MAG: GNAT family N-acetyltransferase [Syntrophales bacterium]